MMYIANPIYDVVFKFMMEDNKVAKLLLSALLKKEIIDLELRPHEYSSYLKEVRISLFRMDFCARIREKDGEEYVVLIELQKTWLTTETLRFRQYLGTQYLNPDTMRKDEDEDFGLPIISIYILGHLLGDIKEPVIYVRRRYLDYNDLEIAGKDKFIESLTHDSVIVQLPSLEGRTRNRLERLLRVFDQSTQTREDDHVLKIDETLFEGEEKLIVQRLLEAGSVPEVRRSMQIEDEILSELEKRDTAVMQAEQRLEKAEQQLEKTEQQLEDIEQQLGAKEQQLEHNKQQLEHNKQQLEAKEQQLEHNKQQLDVTDQRLVEIEQQLEQNKQAFQGMVRLLTQNGVSVDEIAQQLSLSLSEVKALL